MAPTILTASNITFVFGILATMFGVYHYFRNPQIKTDQESIKFRDDINSMKKEILEIRETHLKSVNDDIKDLNKAINDLAITVSKLSTIIDERIPRVNNN